MSGPRDRPSLFGRRVAFPATRWTVLGETEPGAALQAGADYIIVGRSIYGAEDPEGAAERLLSSI